MQILQNNAVVITGVFLKPLLINIIEPKMVVNYHGLAVNYGKVLNLEKWHYDPQHNDSEHKRQSA
jgi:hypothetical protein